MRYDFLETDIVADALLQHMRKGQLPAEKEAGSLDRMPLIEKLRERIGENDVSWLLDVVKEETGARAGLACSLLRKYVLEKQVQQIFVSRWNTAPPYLQNRIMWRLLDDEKLAASSQWRARFLDFVLSEWETFRDFNLTYYGTVPEAAGRIVARVEDPGFIKSKKWIYLCCIPDVVPDPRVARALLRFLADSLGDSDPFVQHVAETMLHEFISEKRQATARSTAPEELEFKALEYVADVLIEYLRDGCQPTEREGDVLNRLPIIDAMRQQVTERDLTWIFEGLQRESGEVAGLYLSLLRKFTGDADVQQRLRDRWSTATPFLKAHLMWRILDDPDLPQEWHERLFAFVLEKWGTFQQVSLKFLGTPQTVVTQALRRLGDPSFPASKKWAYLCRVPEVAEDREAARALLSLGRNMSDPFAQEVAGTLLKRFYV